MASSVVKSVAQQLGKVVVEEAKYLYNVRDKIESLQMELAWMECFLKDADTQQHKEKVVCMWVSHVRDLAYEAEDIIERYLHGVRHHRHDGVRSTLKWFSGILCSSDARTLHKLGSEIDNLTVKIAELTSRLQRYGIQIIKTTRSMEYNSMSREERRTYAHTEDQDVVGLKEEIQLVVEQLVMKTDVKVVAISGTGGLGKTTLARKVYKHKDIKDHFGDNCVWVYISKEFDHMTIFEEILLELEESEEARKRIRRNDLKPKEFPIEISKLLQGKKCLVVVDDIWTEKAWDRLKPAFESIFTTSSSSSKILLTTRNKGLLQHADPSGYLHLQQPLSDNASWELLKRKAFVIHASTDADLLMEESGKEILKHCGGLPIAIIAMGGILSTKTTLSEWNDVQRNISSYLMGSMEPEITNNRLLEILELSYNELPYYLKPCFLYLGIFPEDYEISTHKLYHLWEAEGFLVLEDEVKKKGGTSYDIGERYLNELVQRSMVLVRKCWSSGRIKICQVHDVIRDMCLRQCENVGFLSHIECTKSGMVHGLPPFSTEINKLRRCALMQEGVVDEKRQLFRDKAIWLRSLLVFEKWFNPGRNIWKSCPLLRALDLEGNRKLNRLYGIKCLIHLRYLSLRGTSVEETPSWMFDLQYLETLDLRVYIYHSSYDKVLHFFRHLRCPLEKHVMRNSEFSKMKRLRHLYLPVDFVVEGGKKLTFPRDGQMETIKNFDPERCEIEELMQMTNLRVFSIRKGDTFKKAKKLKMVLEAPVIKKTGQLINNLHLTIDGGVIEKYPGILSPVAGHPSFTGLRIEGRGENVKKKGNNVIFPDSLTRVELDDCDAIGDVLLDLEMLPCLKSLNVAGRQVGNKLLSFSDGSFLQLTELSVKGKMEWEEWEVGKGAFANLESLKLGGWNNLKKVVINELPDSLTQVELTNCEVGEGGVSLLGWLEKLPRLQKLTIEGGGGNKLSFSHGSFPQLTELLVSRQTELEEWEVEEGALANLQSLELKGWHKLKKVVMNELPNSLTQAKLRDCEIGGGDVSLLGCLERLPMLQKLTIHGGGGNKLSFSHGSFPQLIELFLCDQTQLEEWEVGDGALANLLSLKLEDLRNLKKVVINELPNSLTHVELLFCKIEDGCDSLLGCLERLPHLQTLEIKWLEGGNKLSFSPGSFPQLRKLQILYPRELEEWEVGDGALPTLQYLELYKCKKLKKLPEGLPDSVDIECWKPCIKGIEKYNTCPYFKKSGWRLKPMWWLHDSCA